MGRAGDGPGCRTGESSLEPDLDQAGPGVQPACPVRRGDAATSTVVLFGGFDHHRWKNATWTWNGSAWTNQAPASSPPARDEAAMAYDAATRTVVLFGGNDGNYLGDTWIWNGSTWTKQAPVSRPSARYGPMMAYDAAPAPSCCSRLWRPQRRPR